MKTNFRHAVPLYTLSFILAFSLCLPTAGLAYASPDDESDSSTQVLDTETAQASSPCIPSEEDIAKWEADGTLDDRIAFQESLGNGEVSSSLIAQAQQRATGSRMFRSNSGNLPSNVSDDLSMSTTGKAKVLALYVTFQPEKDGTVHEFEDGDTLEALQTLIGSPLSSSNSEDSAQPDSTNSAFAPYDSLNAYYNRSSYGELDISGTAFAYRAKESRSYYDYNIDALFIEALGELDNEINYADYDADGDDYIDAVYIHFAGEHSGWGSTWWSNCSFFQEDPENSVSFDGKKIGCTISLHRPSNTEEGVRTAIHETGHALGLADYYSYNAESVKKDPSWRTGILTFDMMNNNIGDHNAYSKWLLGWIKEDDITRVVVNDSSITVMEGGVKRELDLSEGSYSATISKLATNNPQDCGGFIAVSNDEALLDSNGLLSSFYLLEYNGYGGNQVVQYRAGYNNGHDVAEQIPSGFRLFRIQAEVDPSTGAFVHANKSDDVHNQFIELVDHDGYEQHVAYSGVMENTSIEGTGHSPYGCMMTKGDAIGPNGIIDAATNSTSSYPSTNYYESLSLGFTGISIKVTESSDTQGSVSVSYEGSLKPTLSPSSLSLTLAESRGVSNIDAIELNSSAPVMRGESGLVYVKAKDTCAIAVVEQVEDSSITVSYSMPPELFVPGESCEIIFPARYFFIGNSNGEDFYSEELRVQLPIGKVVSYDEVGDYLNAESDTCVVSNPTTSVDGTTYFAVQNEGRISLCTVNPNDPTKTLVSEIQGSVNGGAYKIQLESVPDGRLCLITTAYKYGLGIINDAHWIDPITAKVNASVTAILGEISTVSVYENAIAISKFSSRDWYYDEPSKLVVEVYELSSNDTTPTSSCTVEHLESVHEVSGDKGKIALVGEAYSDYSGVVKIVDPLALASSDAPTVHYSEVDAEATIDASSYSGVSAFARYNDGYLALAYDQPAAAGSPDLENGSGNTDSEIIPAWRGSTELKGYIVSFDSSGVIQSSYLFGTFPTRGATFNSISISPKGVPAAEISLDTDKGGDIRRVLFFRDSITSAPISLSNETSTSGTWLSNDAWLEVNFNFPRSYFFSEDDLMQDEDSGALGSPDLSGEGLGEGGAIEGLVSGDGMGDGELIGSGYEEQSRPVHYLIAFLPSDGGEGGGSVEPSPDPVPGNGNGNTLSNTGDATGLMAIGCAVAAIAAIVVAVLAFRASRKKR